MSTISTIGSSLVGVVIGSYILYWVIVVYKPSDFLVFSKDAFFGAISCICLVLENDGTIMEANPEALKLFSFAQGGLKGLKYDDLLSILTTEKNASFEMNDSGIIMEIYLNNKQMFFQIFTSPISDKNEKQIGNFIEMRDITPQQEKIEELNGIANFDPLTNLYNRRYFDYMCSELNTEKNLPIAIVSGDLNKLKTTNDSYGHTFGDRLIVVSSEILLKAAPENAIIARHGGDEFLIILPKTDEADALKYIEDVNKLCKDTFEEPFGNPSISLGYAVKYSIEEDFKSTINNADEVMYKDKRKLHAMHEQGQVMLRNAGAERKGMQG